MHSPDERFHRGVTEFLDEWWRLRGGWFEMVRVVGDDRSARSHEVRDLLSRNDIPYGFYASDSPEGRDVLAAAGVGADRLPVIVLSDGRVLIDPKNRDVGAALGATVRPGTETYDLTIVGGGPAGLAAAVYAGSEGLRTALIEPEALGGQAGTSSLIRNYLGFPRGISGGELAARAFEQARLFGTDVIYGSAATSLRAEGQRRIVGLEDGSEVTSRAVVIATGAAYRRLGVPELEALTGCGVFYGAVAEAQALDGEQVFVVGGGNSAGQAAVHLAKHAAHVTILVRSHSPAASMSAYLVNEIDHRANIDVRYGVEILGGGGDGHLEWLDLSDRKSGVVESVPAAALFVLIGARPFTAWLPDSVARDEWGYVLTGARCGIATCEAPAEFANVDAQLEEPRPPLPLETSLSGVFAVGDVRQGSAKRVASAVGDGSVCVGLTHELLSLRGSADGAARAARRDRAE